MVSLGGQRGDFVLCPQFERGALWWCVWLIIAFCLHCIGANLTTFGTYCLITNFLYGHLGLRFGQIAAFGFPLRIKGVALLLVCP